jgi:hypothetical protein
MTASGRQFYVRTPPRGYLAAAMCPRRANPTCSKMTLPSQLFVLRPSLHDDGAHTLHTRTVCSLSKNCERWGPLADESCIIFIRVHGFLGLRIDDENTGVTYNQGSRDQPEVNSKDPEKHAQPLCIDWISVPSVSIGVVFQARGHAREWFACTGNLIQSRSY